MFWSKNKQKKIGYGVYAGLFIIAICIGMISTMVGNDVVPTATPVPLSTSTPTVQSNNIVGTWVNGDAGMWAISYTFNTDGSVTYTTGAHSGHDAATYKGTWTDSGYINNPGENTVGEDYVITANPTTSVNGYTSKEVIQSLLLYKGNLTYFTSDGISEPANTVMTKQ